MDKCIKFIGHDYLIEDTNIYCKGILIMNEKNMNGQDEFEIINPKWLRIFFYIILFLSLLLILVIGILELLEVTKGIFLPVSYISAIFVISGIIGIYAYYKEKFMLKDGIYYYNKAFKKNQSAKIHLIDHVEIRLPVSSGFLDIVFLDKKNNKLINFHDDGIVFGENTFINSLKSNKIPYYFVGYKKIIKSQLLIKNIEKVLDYLKSDHDFMCLYLYNKEEPFAMAIRSDLYIILKAN